MAQNVLTIDSTSASLKSLRDQLRDSLAAAGFSEKCRHDILVSVGEAVTNAIRHAYGGEPGHKIKVTYEDLADRVVLKIRDWGAKIDFSRIQTAPELPPSKPGGLGSYFMKVMMDDIRYDTSHPDGNELILTKFKEKGPRHEDQPQK